MKKERIKRINRPILFAAYLGFGLLLATVLSFCTPARPKPASTEPGMKPWTEELSPEEDTVQKAYSSFTMAAILMNNQRYEEAKEYLLEATGLDPDSIYLNQKMAVLLKTMKEYEEAARYAQKCMELDPEDIENRILLAEIYALSGDDQSAVTEYQKILELDPEQQRVRLVLTTLLIRRNQLKQALEHLDRLIQEDPSIVIAHYYRGRIYLELGNYEEAEKSYLEALNFNKTMEPALFDLGSLYQLREEFERAAAIYERLLSSYPTNSLARERLIFLYYKLGLKDKAERQIEEIKKQSKPGDPGRQALGLIFLRHGRIEESIAELDLIVSAWPEDDKSRYYLASAYEEKGEHEKALEHFALIKEDSKYYINAQMHRAYILEDLKRYDEAITILQETIDRHREKAELYLMLASVFELKKEYERAIEVIEEGLKHDDKNVELIFRLGVLLDKSGEKEKCLAQMKKILKVNPDHADALNYIGYTYAEQGVRLNEALDLIQKALSIKPNSGYIIDSLGWVYYQQGLYDKALDSLEKAVSFTPTDPTIKEHLGDVYFRKKMYHQALEMYEKALSLDHPKQEKIEEKIEEVKKFID